MPTYLDQSIHCFLAVALRPLKAPTPRAFVPPAVVIALPPETALDEHGVPVEHQIHYVSPDFSTIQQAKTAAQLLADMAGYLDPTYLARDILSRWLRCVGREALAHRLEIGELTDDVIRRRLTQFEYKVVQR